MPKHRSNWFYKATGQIAYILLRPLIRLVIKRSKRVKIILHDGNRVLLVKNWLSRQDWQLPSGGLKASELAEQAITRELHEELGLRLEPKSLKSVLSSQWQSDRLGYDYQVFSAKLSHLPAKFRPSLEIVEAAWFDREQLNWQKLNLETEAALAKFFTLPR